MAKSKGSKRSRDKVTQREQLRRASAADAHRQSLAVARSPLAGEDQAFIEAVSSEDDRPEVRLILANLHTSLPELERLLRECKRHWGYEDGIYRFYHHSFKVYALQEMTSAVVAALRGLSPERQLNASFMTIVRDGTGKTFEPEHNRRWLEVTRPIVEAFLHALYFLEMAVRYAKDLQEPPRQLPSGWAALLHLYNLR